MDDFRTGIDRCHLCGSESYTVLYQMSASTGEFRDPHRTSETCLQKPGKIVRCIQCGFIYAFISRKDLDGIVLAYIEMNDEDYVRESEGRVPNRGKCLRKY